MHMQPSLANCIQSQAESGPQFWLSLSFAYTHRMITRRALPALAPASRIGCRTFLSNIVPPEVQTYHIKKVLNYPPELMYSVVSDVASYSSFVPYCLESTITARDESRTPTAATLRVGWKDLDESFESQLSFTPTSVEV